MFGEETKTEEHVHMYSECIHKQPARMQKMNLTRDVRSNLQVYKNNRQTREHPMDAIPRKQQVEVVLGN